MLALFVAFLAFVSTAKPQPCDQTCQQSQREALIGIYSSLDGPHWLRVSGWTDTAEHCTWDGVECCNQTVSSIVVPCRTPGAVTALDLSVNNATGTWPASGLGALAASLTSLSLRGNYIQGSLPESIGTLQHLSVLSIDDNSLTGPLPANLGQLQNLTQLTAAANKFSGTIPSSLSRLQQLQWLLLNDNQLTGRVPAELFALPQLQLLALQGNMLQGPLPTTAVAQQGAALTASGTGPLKLVEVRLSHNQLTGSISTFVAQLPTLLLDISHNRLTGSLPGAFSTNRVLRELYLRNNQLSGTLSPDLLSAHLQSLDLSSNKLTGSIPTLATTSYYIQILNLSNNSFTGVIPADLGRLVNLQQVDWSANRLTPQDSLPGSLVLDSSQPPVSADPTDLALQCQPVVAARNPTAQVTLDPSSYGYEGCNCKDPFVAVVGRAPDGAVTMTCTVQQQQQDNKKLAHVLGPLLAVVGVLLVALVAVAAAWRWGLTGIVQRFSDQSEKKVPPGGTAKDVTLVLTDVQGSTELWEWDQELAAEAFKLHDRILRQYMTLFYGYEVSTEGDAFLVAFHEPFDAAAWCLCVQLALHYADWPTPLLQHKSTCLDTEETLERKRRQWHDKWHSRRSAAHNMGAVDTLGPHTADEVVDSGQWSGATDALIGTPVAAADEGYETIGANSAMDPRTSSRAGTATATNGNKVVGSSILFRGLRVRMSIATGGVESVRLHSVTQRAEYVGEVLRKVQAVGETPQGGQIIMDSETFRGVNSRLPELGAVVLEATQKLLRSRAMPSALELASMFSCPPGTEMAQSRDPGWLKNGQDCVSTQHLPNAHNSDITSRSNRLEPNVAGPPDQQDSSREQTSAARLSSGANGGSGRRRSMLLDSYIPAEGDIEEGGVIGPSDHSRDQAGLLHQAAVLFGLQDDSDESNLQGTNDSMATFAAEHTTATSPRATLTGLGRLGKRQRQRERAANGLQRDRRRSSLSYGIMVIDMGVHQLSELAQKIDLVQVMPCGLEDRARFFPRLDSLRQDTPGYFDAPAAGLVPLSPSGDLKGVTIPQVTIVFCTIDKYCDLVEANRTAAELALELYSDCVRWLLLVGGGYECQESEGTFMVAFSSPDVAIEWCLMVQQVLKDMSWPASVLDLPTCEEERDMHGNVMFRGPRVKMGVYSGTPTRVMPHTTTGRADYFGPLVNRAARYCHAAARGGQVLVPKELMCEVIGKWVNIDSIELMQSDRLLDFVAFFDEERRLWPWMFKRRSHWDMPMSALYPSIPPPPPFMGPSWQQAAAAAAATPHVWGSGLSGMQMASMPAAADGVDDGVAADFPSPEAATTAGDAADQPDAVGSVAPEVYMLHSTNLERSSNRNVDRQGLGVDLATPRSGLDEAELMASVSQVPGGAGDTVPLGRLAPLHESAEGSSSGSPSEAGGSHRHVTSARSQTTVPAYPMQRQPRRYSDVSQQFSRLGPQHLQALQMQYNQGLAAAAAHSHPYGFLQNQNAPQQFKRSFPGSAPISMLPAPLWGGLGQQGLLSSRYRRPSYLSDVSSRYRRFSNTSELSLPGTINSVAWAPWVLAQPQQQDPSSRRPSALSEFFPVGPHSRRSSNVSTDRQGSWLSVDPASGCGRAPDRSRFAPAPAAGTAATATSTAAAAGGGVPQPATAQQQQAQQLHQHLQRYQRQQTEQQLKQQMLPGGRVGSGESVGQAAGSDVVPSLPMSYRSHSAGASAATGAAAAAGGAVVRPQSSLSRQSGPVAAAQAQQQQPGTPRVNSSREAATTPVPGSNAVAWSANQSGSGASAGHRASAGTPQSLTPGRQQQQGGHWGPVQASLGGHRLPQRSSSGGNSSTRDMANVSRQSSHTSQPAVPAALLVRGLESQVLPGMLHSSNRLRLVSKRRRQMSYVFSQESSNPGVPADGADPKRLVGYSSGYGLPLAPHASSGTPPTSEPSDGAGSAVMAAAGPRFVGSNGGSSRVSGGNSANASRRGSSRTSGSGESLHHQSLSSSQQQQQRQPDITDPATAASVIDSSSRLPGMAEAENEGSRANGTTPVPAADATGVAAAAAAAATAAQNPFWSATVMGDYCGLPEIEPLPDLDVLESLRLAATTRARRPSNVSTLVDSIAGFEGRNIGSMCADIMRGRWLWIVELLVHDLGQFRFKGVAGVHSIVSVTSEELGGRTFPTTIRRGKGEQIRLGRGLLANVQMRARARQPGWGPYAGQQLLQNPAPQPPVDPQTGQPHMPVGVGICHACSGVGLQTFSSTSAPMAAELSAAGVPFPDTEHPVSGLAGLRAASTPSSAGGARGGGVMVGPPGLQSAEQQLHHSAALHGVPTAGGLPAGTGLPPMAMQTAVPGSAMLKVGSLGDIRALSASSSTTPAMPAAPLMHMNSAPESVAAALAAQSSSSNNFGAGYLYADPMLYPGQLPADTVRQHWQTLLLQQHYWQQQRLLQQQQSQRRRHSVCVGSVHRAAPTQTYGVQAEMLPFQESETLKVQVPNSASAAAAPAHSGSNVGPDQQQSHHQQGQQQWSGGMGAARGADAGASARSAAAVVPAGGYGLMDGRDPRGPIADGKCSSGSNYASSTTHASDTVASIKSSVPPVPAATTAAMHGAVSYSDLDVLPAGSETDNDPFIGFGAVTCAVPGDTGWVQKSARQHRT